jgi:hypothetical protein
MKKIFFTNISFPGNAGDFWSSPVHYYDFSKYNFEQIHYMYIWDALEGRERDFYLLKDSIVVVGGGGLITSKGDHLQNTLEYLVENNKVIFWGSGTNTQFRPSLGILNHPNVILSGIRDFNFKNYLPCVSCKNILFDKKYVEKGGIGILEGAGLPVDIPNYPRISNDRPIEEILEFISDKSIIISATFHGIYWSQLMSKKVLYYSYDDNLINSKYLNIKHRVDICNKENYLEKIYNISSTEGFKEECRNLNDNFYREVIKLF